MLKKGISNNILYGALIAVVIIIIGIYLHDNYSVSGYAVDGTQNSSVNNNVLMDSNKNITINDAYLESINGYLSEELQNISQKTASKPSISCSWNGWSKDIPSSNCTCIILSKKVSCGQSYNNISCTCLNHMGRAYYCSGGKITQVKDYWYKDNCKDYTFNVKGGIESPSVGANIGPTEGSYPGFVPSDVYGYGGMLGG